MDGNEQADLWNVTLTFKPCSLCRRTAYRSCPFGYMNCWYAIAADDVPRDSISDYKEQDE